MRRWSAGTNNFYFTGSIFLEEAPWYIFFIEWSIMWICHFIPRIPLPKIKIVRDTEETNLREYYGTTADLFHIYVCSNISQWCWDKTKNDCVSFPYDKLIELIPNSEDLNEYSTDSYDNDEDLKKNLEYSKLVGEEFKVVYDKLENISGFRMNEIDKKDHMKKIIDEVNSDKIIGEDNGSSEN
jgi:hypothetical protein